MGPTTSNERAGKIADKFENIDQTGLHEAGYGPDDFE